MRIVSFTATEFLQLEGKTVTFPLRSPTPDQSKHDWKVARLDPKPLLDEARDTQEGETP